MSSLSDITLDYIDRAFQPELKAVILRAVSSVFDDAQISRYETTLINIINSSDSVSTDDMRSMFISNIRQILVDMTEQYLLTVDMDEEPTLLELVEICEAISRSAKLESEDVISSFIHSDKSARLIVIDVIKTLSTLSELRCMELITDAKDDLIEAIRAVYADKTAEVDTPVSGEVAKTWVIFCAFIGEAGCLGKVLSDSGFKHLELKPLLSLGLAYSTPVPATLTHADVPQIALDVLSVLLYASDMCTDPLSGMDTVLQTHVPDASSHAQIKQTISHIYSDYKLFRDAYAQSEIARSQA